jgi:hypothetical protein
MIVARLIGPRGEFADAWSPSEVGAIHTASDPQRRFDGRRRSLARDRSRGEPQSEQIMKHGCVAIVKSATRDARACGGRTPREPLRVVLPRRNDPLETRGSAHPERASELRAIESGAAGDIGSRAAHGLSSEYGARMPYSSARASPPELACRLSKHRIARQVARGIDDGIGQPVDGGSCAETRHAGALDQRACARLRRTLLPEPSRRMAPAVGISSSTAPRARFLGASAPPTTSPSSSPARA